MTNPCGTLTGVFSNYEMETSKIAELPDSIHISPEYLYQIQDDSSIAIREFLRHFVEKIFPKIIGN